MATGPQNATREMTHRYGLRLPSPASFNRERKKRKSKGLRKLKIKKAKPTKDPVVNGQILTDYKHLALSKTEGACQWCVGTLRPLCTLCGCYGKHHKLVVPCVSQIISKTEIFPLNQNLTCANYGIYVAICMP